MGPTHLEALRRLNRPVVGILGSSAGKSERMAQELGLDTGYPDLEALLADSRVDTVHVTSPNDTHFEYCLRLIEAGKHVVCEKPLATNSRESKELLEAAKARPDVLTAVNYNLRYYPMALYARELVRSGELGEIYHASGSFVQDWLLYEDDWSWRVDAQAGGALRAVGDIGTHWLDMVQWITGQEVDSLTADLATFLEYRNRPTESVGTFSTGDTPSRTERVQVDTEDFGSVLLRFSGGARGVMHVSQVNAGRKNRFSFEIAGSKASLAWNGERPNELWIGRRDRPNEVVLKDPGLLPENIRHYSSYPGGHAEGFPDTFKQMYRDVYAYIDAGDMSAPRSFATFEDGHLEVLLCEAILASHRNRQWVSVRGDN